MTLLDRTVVQSAQHTSPDETQTDSGTSRDDYPVQEARATEPVAGGKLVRERVPVQTPRTGFGAGVRILFGLVWVADVYFKWQPSFLHRLPDVMSEGVKGQPAWLKPWFALVQGVVAVHPTAWAYMIALLESGLALALMELTDEQGFALLWNGAQILHGWCLAEQGQGRAGEGIA